MDSFRSDPAIVRGGQSLVISLANIGLVATASFEAVTATIRLTILMGLAVMLACTLIVLENHGRPRATPRMTLPGARRREPLAVLK